MTMQDINFDKSSMSLNGVKITSMALASAIASQIYEGFVPTKASVSAAVDYANGKLSITEIAEIAKKKLYV